MTTEEMQKELVAVKERNKRVETDKAWEVSWTRRLFIAAVTYITAGVWLVTINDTNPGSKRWFLLLAIFSPRFLSRRSKGGELRKEHSKYHPTIPRIGEWMSVV